MAINVGLIEVGMASLALLISMGATAVTLGGRMSALEENVRHSEEKLGHLYKVYEVARTDLKDQLDNLNNSLNQINVVMGRVDERTQAQADKLKELERKVSL